MACIAALWPTSASRVWTVTPSSTGSDIIRSAEFCRLDRLFRRAVGGYENDGQPRLRCVQLAHQVQAAEARHSQVRNDQVERIFSGARQPFVPPLFHRDLVAFLSQRPAQRITDSRIILDQ